MDESSRSELEAVAANQQIFGFLLAIHGAVHVFGAVISWRLFEFLNFRYEDVWPAAGTWPARFSGLLWLIAAGVLIVVGIRLALRRQVDAVQIAAPLVLSLAVTLTALPESAPGAVLSGGILGAMAFVAAKREVLHRRRTNPARH